MESKSSEKRRQYLDDRHEIVTHRRIVNMIADQYGLNRDKVANTINSFFSKRGLLKHMKMGSIINITGFGILRPNRTRQTIMRRKEDIDRKRNRLKRKRFVTKK